MHGNSGLLVTGSWSLCNLYGYSGEFSRTVNRVFDRRSELYANARPCEVSSDPELRGLTRIPATSGTSPNGRTIKQRRVVPQPACLRPQCSGKDLVQFAER